MRNRIHPRTGDSYASFEDIEWVTSILITDNGQMVVRRMLHDPIPKVPLRKKFLVVGDTLINR